MYVNVVQSEVHFLGRISHPNLVTLLGYCLEETELLLVYEFMQKGSLENHLFGSECSVIAKFINSNMKCNQQKLHYFNLIV